MPVWQNADGSERVVISSREELYQRNKPLGQITKFIFVRHGESESNVAKVFGTSETVLTERGHKQAEDIVASLTKEKIDITVASPFERTVQTATPLAQKLGMEIILDDRVQEWNVGQYRGQSSISEEAIGDTKKAHLDRLHKRGIDGECMEEVITRGEQFILDMQNRYPGKTIAFFSHNGFGKVFFSHIKNNPSLLTKRIHNCEIIPFYIDNNTGKELNLHRPYIDRIELPGKDGNNLRRIPEVLDVWMDSASMPYAQVHYPFENQEKMEASFPADFIAEYTGQIRAWFYVMHAIGVMVK